MSRVRTLAAVLGLLLTGAAPGGPSPREAPEHELKAEFIARFTLFVEWPGADPDAPFYIGVVGGGPIAAPLRRAAERVMARPVEVLAVAPEEATAAFQVLYIPATAAPRLDEILARTRGRPVLTVGDGPGFAARGTVINFYRESGQVRFEINRTEAERSGLRLGSKLFRLARVVDSGAP